MKKFDSAKMMEDELEQVVGGRKYAILTHKKDGKVGVETFSFEGDLDAVKTLIAGGSVSKCSFVGSYGKRTIQEKYFSDQKKRLESRGYTIYEIQEK